MKETLRYYLFITLATLFIGIAFTSSDFFTSPVDSLKDTCILCFQWGVLMLALWPVIYLVSVNKYIFAVLYPFICVLSGVLAYFRYTTGTILTTAILDVVSDNHSQSTVFNFNLILIVLGCLIVSAGMAVFRFRKIKINKHIIHCMLAIAFICIMFHIPRIRGPVKNR
ncbi:MAG: hypothetical protein LBB85_00485, partial [Dysgonamonadaceae bacterium]|nr:hypothetical protein [Dysgonamonadaceae bacterium]